MATEKTVKLIPIPEYELDVNPDAGFGIPGVQCTNMAYHKDTPCNMLYSPHKRIYMCRFCSNSVSYEMVKDLINNHSEPIESDCS